LNHEESQIQAAIVSILSMSGIFLFMVPNGEMGRISMAAASRAKAMGLRSGLSDLVLISFDGRAHFLEIKTATGKLSESQKRFQALCSGNGWPYAVARSVEEAVDICKGWGLIK